MDTQPRDDAATPHTSASDSPTHTSTTVPSHSFDDVFSFGTVATTTTLLPPHKLLLHGISTGTNKTLLSPVTSRLQVTFTSANTSFTPTTPLLHFGTSPFNYSSHSPFPFTVMHSQATPTMLTFGILHSVAGSSMLHPSHRSPRICGYHQVHWLFALELHQVWRRLKCPGSHHHHLGLLNFLLLYLTSPPTNFAWPSLFAAWG